MYGNVDGDESNLCGMDGDEDRVQRGRLGDGFQVCGDGRGCG